jgi:O-antigen/teichoic acid export membrane protein
LIALLAVHLSIVGALAFALLIVAWELEEYVRRTFMARLEFGLQGLNDLIYLVTSLGSLWVLSMFLDGSVPLALIAMSLGALTAFVAGQLMMPAADRMSLPTRNGGGVGEVARYGLWRAAQAGSGYMTQVLVRYFVIAATSLAAVGNLEAARVAFGPLFTLLAASSNLLLPLIASRHASAHATKRLVLGATAGLVFASLGYGAVVVTWPEQIGNLLVGGEYAIGRVATVAWLGMTLVLALTGPLTTLAFVVVSSAQVFWIRLLGSLAGLAMTIPLSTLVGASAAPMALALGLLLSGTILGPLAWARLRSRMSGGDVDVLREDVGLDATSHNRHT